MATELYNHDKIYIMDNHMLASWCWSKKIDLTQKYNFFHIDRHYDLIENNTDDIVNYILSNNIDLNLILVDDFLDMSIENRLFTHDNYIIIFEKLYSILAQKAFVTHKDGNIPQSWENEIYKTEFYELIDNTSYWINDREQKFILNIDMDYFIRKYDDNACVQMFTDEYITMIGNEIKDCYDNIEVITIALTPTFCCSMENSKRLAKVLLSGIDPNYNWNF
ncbi:hypothetical protein [Empedobacter tilapiae]